jgi:hypothetical protein
MPRRFPIFQFPNASLIATMTAAAITRLTRGTRSHRAMHGSDSCGGPPEKSSAELTGSVVYLAPEPAPIASLRLHEQRLGANEPIEIAMDGAGDTRVGSDDSERDYDGVVLGAVG